ncbi:SPX-domain-containing protein [Polychaeton citri CBS 116435]|uniref:SPX-domain-containing protein n=1 Tax=Polychaeton citri CBS 116435 TaxID=1314669 RepID=A0A9P4UJV9_9PEZI|nr:SPX-domain-containing protein [Polychaeton citri CBS 116435]
MRFGQTLRESIYTPWKDNYIDYSKLKKLLREDEPASAASDGAGNDRWTEEDEGAFVDELVNVQLERVHEFHKDTYEKLRDRTAKCEARLDDVAVHPKSQTNGEGQGDSDIGNGKRPVPSEQEKQKIVKEVLTQLDDITKEINELEKYSRINYAGFLKAAKKHDRKRGQAYRVRPLLQVRLAALPFNKEDYSPLLYRLSAMYNFVRQHHGNVDQARMSRGMSMSDSRQDLDEYVSYKFWVHPENLLEVKTLILRRLPVLVYNPQTSKIAEGSRPDPSMTSIYFDSPAFKLYTNKVDHGEASSLRLRWYGQLNSKPDIWIEKKTVKEDDTSEESKFTTKEKYIQRFINDEYKMEKQIQKLKDRAGPESGEAVKLEQSVDEIQAFIKENKLQPVLRASYSRTAFQIPGDDKVRVSLDTDLAFIREDALDTDRPCRDPDSWHRTDIDNSELEYPYTSIRKGEISRFPFALLEVKVRNAANRKNPEWIQDLMSSHLIKEAPRFSKFVHGVASLFEDYVNTFPFWLSDVETDIRRDPQQAFEEEQAKKQKEREDEFAVGSLIKSSMPKSSPKQRSHRGAVMSPVGSPDLAQSKATINSVDSRKPRNYGSIAAGNALQENVAEEADDDETGQQAHDSGQPISGGLKGLFPSFSTSKYAEARRNRTKLPPGVVKPEVWIKDQGPVKVEAKVWLANQRTFIKWQHVSVLLASLSLGLYNAAGEHNNIARALALVYTLVAILTAAWGYGIYMWRINLIQKRSGKDFDAITGPVVVCLGLIFALALNFGFKYRLAVEQREQHGGASTVFGLDLTNPRSHANNL